MTRHLRRIGPSFLAAATLVPMGLALNYALNVVLARTLSVAGFGLFAYVQSLASVLALAATLGFGSSMMRFVAAYRAQGSDELLLGVTRATLRLVVAATAAVAVALLALAWVLPDPRASLLWTAALLVPQAIDAWRESTTRGTHRTTVAILPRQVLLPLATVAVVLLTGLRDAGVVLAVYIGTFAALQIVAMVHLRKLLAVAPATEPRFETGAWLRASVPMGLTALARLGMNRWDVVALGVFAGFADVGPYAAAARTALLARLVLRVVNLVLGPILAERHELGDRAGFRRLLVLATLGSVAMGIPLFVLAVLFPHVVLSLFGAGYVDAATPLRILATGQVLSLVTGPVGLALNMSGHERAHLGVVVVASVASLIGLAFLVPPYGAVGAALATAGAQAVLVVGLVALWPRLVR